MAAPFFDRSWRVSLQPQAGGRYDVSSVVSPSEEPLRVRFSVGMSLTMAFWQATIEIYNLASATAKQVTSWTFGQQILSGDVVTLSAGYRPGASGSFDAQSNVIYAGQVMQPIWTRENVVDSVLRLRCVTNLAAALYQVKTAAAAGASDLSTLGKICEKCGMKSDVDAIAQETLDESKYSRGQVIQGRPAELIRQIVKQNNLFAWINEDGLHVRSFDIKTLDATPIKFAYGTPQSDYSNVAASTTIRPTLIGTPQGTQDGIAFQVLMDPTVRIGDVVQIAKGVLASLFQFQYGKDLPVPPSTDGKFVVSGLRQIGDTRGTGNDWITEITGKMLNFFPDFLKARTVTPAQGATNGQ